MTSVTSGTAMSLPSNGLAAAPGRQKDLAAHLSTLDAVPLFMKQLPQEGKEQDTTVIDALQSLTFDGTPDEVASNFKKQGNEYFMAKRYTDARAFYTQAIDAYPTDSVLKETLLINRAACNLAMENYGQVLRDCSAALGLNPGSVKAFFRSAKALLSLGRYVEATDCCDHALQLDPSNTEVARLRATIEHSSAAAQKRQAECREVERRATETKNALGKAFLARGLWIQNTARPPDNPHPPHFDPESLPASSKSETWRAPDPIRTPVVFPVVFLYPQHRQSDLISHFHEDSTLGSHLDAMFPPHPAESMPWDANREYQSDNLNLYATTHAKRLLRIGKKLTLREAIDHCARDADRDNSMERDGLALQDGLLSLIVLPKGKAEKEWIETFKNDRDRSVTT